MTVVCALSEGQRGPPGHQKSKGGPNSWQLRRRQPKRARSAKSRLTRVSPGGRCPEGQGPPVVSRASPPSVPLIFRPAADVSMPEDGHPPERNRDSMADPRVDRLARVLVHYSMKVRKGD